MAVGIVGIGTMGMLVAQLLLEKGEPVVVYDASSSALQRAAQMGASIADTPAHLTTLSDIILLLLPGPSQVEAVVAELLSAGQAQPTLIDMSTVDPQTTRRMGQQAAGKGIHYLDAPILGRPAGVGRWVLPVGGEAKVLERCRPVLEKLAQKVIHVGPLGAGHTLKLLNALMFSAINAMTAEMMAISVKAGLEPGVLYQTIAGSEAATVSGLFKECGRKIVERNFDPAFTVDLLCKDNGLAIQMAKDMGAPPILASAIQTINELARATGHGAEDTSALVKVYEQLFGLNESRG